MNFRIATVADGEQLAQMRWDMRAEDGDEQPVQSRAEFEKRHEAFLREGIESGRWVWWVAEEEGVLTTMMAVNVITPVPRPSRLVDRWGYLTNVYTRPKWRNAGVGTELMDHMLSWAGEADLAELIVSPSDRSRPFYKRAGFGPDDEYLLQKLRGSDDV